MKKLVFVLAATLAVAAPTLVRAQGFSIDLGDDGYRDRGDYREYRGVRTEYRDHDRGRHRGWDHRYDHRRGDRVIIKRHRHDWDDED